MSHLSKLKRAHRICTVLDRAAFNTPEIVIETQKGPTCRVRVSATMFFHGKETIVAGDGATVSDAIEDFGHNMGWP